MWNQTSGQDGGVGSCALCPCATLHNPRKNYNQISKTNNTQNHQKIKLYGSPTTKDLKKPHSSRQVGGAESWGWGREAVWHGEAVAVVAEQTVPHSRVGDRNQEGYPGSEPSQPQARQYRPRFQHREGQPPLHLALKTSGGWGGGRTAGFSPLKGPAWS